jgi:hypothetical protein
MWADNEMKIFYRHFVPDGTKGASQKPHPVVVPHTNDDRMIAGL